MNTDEHGYLCCRRAREASALYWRDPKTKSQNSETRFKQSISWPFVLGSRQYKRLRRRQQQHQSSVSRELIRVHPCVSVVKIRVLIRAKISCFEYNDRLVVPEFASA
jgi:hypothetical protein